MTFFLTKSWVAPAVKGRALSHRRRKLGCFWKMAYMGYQGLCNVSLSSDAIYAFRHLIWKITSPKNQLVQRHGSPNHHTFTSPAVTFQDILTIVETLVSVPHADAAIQWIKTKSASLCVKPVHICLRLMLCSQDFSLPRMPEMKANTVDNLCHTVLILRHLPDVPMVLQVVSAAGIHRSHWCWWTVNGPGLVLSPLSFHFWVDLRCSLSLEINAID